MTDVFSTPRHRIRTFILLAICGWLAVSAWVVGIDDNPPGILLAFLAAIALVLSFVHPWRTTRQFKSLVYASLLGVAIFAIVNNILETFAHSSAAAGALQLILQGFAVSAFLLATLICPAAFIVGAVGLVAMFIRNHHQPTPGSKPAA